MRFRYFRILFSDFVLLPAMIFCLLNVSLMTYALRLAKGQWTIVTEAREFSEVYADPMVSEEIKTKLHLIEDIKQFAYDSIGLKQSDNYTSFYDQKGQRLMYVVTAAEPFDLKAHLWHFPVLGDVPYKGFFDETQANSERDRLILQGLDVDIGGASAWSTLGWFRDPVLSSMLKRSEGDLAELIIHELTHGTIFVTDSVDYNENFAQFVGVEGAKWFLTSKYGSNSLQLTAYLNGNLDEEKRTAFMLMEANWLSDQYKNSFTARMSDAQKSQKKKELFSLIAADADTLQLQSDSTFALRLKEKLNKSGNTVFLQYTRYEAKRDDFSDQFVRDGNDLHAFVQNMIGKYGS